MPQPIPFHRPSITQAEIDAVSAVLRSGWLTTGPKVKELEAAVAAYVGGKDAAESVALPHAVALSSCTAALHLALIAVGVGPGDEVVTSPYTFVATGETILYLGARPVFVDVEAATKNMDPALLERAITPKTRAIVVNSPANPSGKVFTRDELKTIADFAQTHDLFVFTDEIYEYFLYDDHEHVSIGTLPGMKERTVTISGYSKTFSITGWRIGYTVSDARWAHAIGYYSDLCYVCAPAPLQFGVAAGIAQLKPDFYRHLGEEYAQKRDLICSTLTKVGLTPSVPQGAYYVLADASRLPGRNSKEKAMYLLEKTGVACVPGGAFYHDAAGENLIRFCYAKIDTDLQEACERLKKI